MEVWSKLAWIAAAGACGALSRYGLGGWVQRLCGTTFPWGTLAVNALGCLLFGFFWSLASERFAIRSEVRVIVLIGFLGSFTTFSTFAFETADRLRGAEWAMALGNMAAHNVLGIIAVFLGLALGRLL